MPGGQVRIAGAPTAFHVKRDGISDANRSETTSDRQHTISALVTGASTTKRDAWRDIPRSSIPAPNASLRFGLAIPFRKQPIALQCTTFYLGDESPMQHVGRTRKDSRCLMDRRQRGMIQPILATRKPESKWPNSRDGASPCPPQISTVSRETGKQKPANPAQSSPRQNASKSAYPHARAVTAKWLSGICFSVDNLKRNFRQILRKIAQPLIAAVRHRFRISTTIHKQL